MANIDNLSIEISASADAAVRSLNRLQSAIRPLGGSAKNTASGMKALESDMKDVGGTAQKTSESIDKIETTLNKVKKATGVFDTFKSKLSGASVSISDMAKSMTKLPFQTIKGALVDLPKYFGGRLVSGIKSAVKSFDTLFASLKRIAFYRLIRTAIKEITKGLTEGIKNLYHWSEAVGTTFHQRMNQMATASNYLKNSFAAMVSPLIESLAPAIDLIVDKFVDMFNIVNQVFALLTGKSTYTAALKIATAWDEETKNANKSAKELRATLLGFDEINRLNGDTSGSGSSGKQQKDYSNLFETRNISSWVTDMVNSGDYSALGRAIANKINQALSSINWETVKSKGVNFVKSITSVINGFISDIDPKTVGQSLAEVINTGATMIDQFWSSIDWLAAGIKLRVAILNFFNKIDVEQLASAFTAKFKSIVTFITNALPSNPEEWRAITSKISGLINSCILKLSQTDIGTLIGKVIYGGMKLITQLAEDGTLKNIAEAVKKAIGDALAEISIEDVKELVTAVLKDVLDAISVLFSIKLELGGVSISALSVLGFIAAAGTILKNSVGKMFGSASISGIGSGIAIAAGITLAIQAVVELAGIINGIVNGNGVDWSQVGSFVSKAALATGLFLAAKGHFPAALVALGIGLVIEPCITEIADVVEDIKKNGFTAKSVLKLLNPVFKAAGISSIGMGLEWQNNWLLEAAAQQFAKYGNADIRKPMNGLGSAISGNYIGIAQFLDNTEALNKHTGVLKMMTNGGTLDKNTKAMESHTGVLKLMTKRSSSAPNYNGLVNTSNALASSVYRTAQAIGLYQFLDDNASVDVAVNYVPQSADSKRYVNDPLGALAKQIAPGVDTNARVTLKKTNWTTIDSFVGTLVTVGTKLVKKNWSNIDSFVGTLVDVATNLTRKNWITLEKYVGNRTDVEVDLYEGNYDTISDFVGTWTDVSVMLLRNGFKVGLASFLTGNDKGEVNVKVNVTGTLQQLAQVLVNSVKKARGGIFSNGLWSDIPQYASGTTNAHGSLFLAGEAGPEIVGHVGGRTEVLNKSQIASAMYSAVHSAMQGVSLDANIYSDGGVGMEEMMEYFRADGEAMRQQNDLLRQQNELLRQINDKDYSIDISTADINRAQTRMNRRAGTTIVPVGV